MRPTAAQTDLKSLESFLSILHSLRTQSVQPSAGADRLANFLGEIARLRKLVPEATPLTKSEPLLDSTRFAKFAAKFRRLHVVAWSDGAFVDVWKVAGVQSNELRNAAVLAWLLDARQTHGRGNAFLAAWLRRLDPVPFLSLSAWDKTYSVATETYPLGDMENRVDIVLESTGALIFIEVKVYARENENQVERYLALANAKARARSDAVNAGVIYLTPSWALPPAVHAPPERVVHATWTDVADAIEEVVQPTRGFVDRLTLQFAIHVRKF